MSCRRMICAIACAVALVLVPSFQLRGLCQESGGVTTLEATVVGGDETQEQHLIEAADVEQSRRITSERIYMLIGLWVMIGLCCGLIALQWRDDERLYKEGYYESDV